MVDETEFGVTVLDGAFEEAGEGYCELTRGVKRLAVIR